MPFPLTPTTPATTTIAIRPLEVLFHNRDRAGLSPGFLLGADTVTSMITSRLRVSKRDGSEAELLRFRLLKSAHSWLLRGLERAAPEEGTLDEWLQEMGLSSVTDGEKTNVPPLLFGVLTGRVGLVREMLDRGADPNAVTRRKSKGGGTLLPVPMSPWGVTLKKNSKAISRSPGVWLSVFASVTA